MSMASDRDEAEAAAAVGGTLKDAIASGHDDAAMQELREALDWHLFVTRDRNQ